ncbi:hypothetical protein, partial [Mycobacterium sp.]|uniref:hypothetical protein n=1 Tax=Mycobacterium sp. TaxID=1785 RepID=UPI003C782B52
PTPLIVFEKELAAASARQGQTLVWSAQESALLAQIASILDRKAEFSELYDAAKDTETKLKISAEVRLLEQAAVLGRQNWCGREIPSSKRSRPAGDGPASCFWGGGAAMRYVAIRSVRVGDERVLNS